MEINNLQNSMISKYKKIAKTEAHKGKTETTAKANTDVVEFDFARSVGAAKANLASNIDATTNEARIQQLTEAYAGDNCPVSPEDVAGAIVS